MLFYKNHIYAKGKYPNAEWGGFQDVNALSTTYDIKTKSNEIQVSIIVSMQNMDSPMFKTLATGTLTAKTMDEVPKDIFDILDRDSCKKWCHLYNLIKSLKIDRDWFNYRVDVFYKDWEKEEKAFNLILTA